MAPLAVAASIGGSGSPPPVIVDQQSGYEGYWIAELYSTTFVEGTITVPSISCSGNTVDTGVDLWIGLDGQPIDLGGLGAGVEQAGVSAWCLSSTNPSYYAWWEFQGFENSNGQSIYTAPNNGQPKTVFSVSPGDRVTIKITYSSPNSITINILDGSKVYSHTWDGNSYEITFEHSTAEWLLENNGGLSNLGSETMTFSQLSATLGGITSNPWNLYDYYQVTSLNEEVFYSSYNTGFSTLLSDSSPSSFSIAHT